MNWIFWEALVMTFCKLGKMKGSFMKGSFVGLRVQ
jgi:hypothetical protein